MGIPLIEDIPEIVAGGLGIGPHRIEGSRIIQNNAAAGCLVYHNDAGQCSSPSAVAHVEAGSVSILRLMVDRIANANGLEWASGDIVQAVREGDIAVLTEEAVAEGQPVYVRFAAKGLNTKLGAFRNDPDITANTFTITIVSTADGAKFEVTESGTVLEYVSGSSQTAAAKATAFAALIDAQAAYTASASGAVITVTKVSGALDIGDVSAPELLTVADTSAATCALLPGARFIGDYVAGAAMLRIKER